MFCEVVVDENILDEVLQEMSQRGCPVDAGKVVAKLAERGIVVTVDEVRDYCRMCTELSAPSRRGEQETAHNTGSRGSLPFPWWTPEYQGE